MIPGLASRLQFELELLGARAPAYKSPEVVVQKGHQTLAWTGGALLASLDDYDTMCMTRQEYDEYGYRHLKKKFLTGEHHLDY